VSRQVTDRFVKAGRLMPPGVSLQVDLPQATLPTDTLQVSHQEPSDATPPPCGPNRQPVNRRDVLSISTGPHPKGDRTYESVLAIASQEYFVGRAIRMT